MDIKEIYKLPKYLIVNNWNNNIPNLPSNGERVILVIYPVFNLWAVTYWNFEANGAVFSIEKKKLEDAINFMSQFLKKERL